MTEEDGSNPDPPGVDDPSDASELLPAVYNELRRLARSRLRRLPPGETLQPTALVHEVYLRLMRTPGWTNRRHFFHAAARAMRDLLVEQARRKAALKHGGGRDRVDLEGLRLAIETPADDMLALNEALLDLETNHPRQHQLVMLRFFAGLGADEAAEVLGVSRRSAERDWCFARAKLFTILVGEGGRP